MVKAYFRDWEIYAMEIYDGWCDVCFYMSDYESPITGTGRYRVRFEDIILKEVEDD